MRGINYSNVENIRTKNYLYLFERLEKINKLTLEKIEGAFVYPLLLNNGSEVRQKLIEQKIYIPVLWPDVLKEAPEDSLEYIYAQNILPLPCDQRYGEDEMEWICKAIFSLGVKYGCTK